MRALRAARTLGLPEWLIAAGFIRNKVWGSVFDKEAAINDIDVIYFCPADTTRERDLSLENGLCELEPDLPWSVKNQARMHLRNGDAPYKRTVDAMRHWPEKQTSIGVMLDADDSVIIRHCFDLSLQFNGSINHNPTRPIEVFNSRVLNKGWLEIWPALEVKN